jgi:hypothetical protein
MSFVYSESAFCSLINADGAPHAAETDKINIVQTNTVPLKTFIHIYYTSVCVYLGWTRVKFRRISPLRTKPEHGTGRESGSNFRSTLPTEERRFLSC